MKPRAVLVPHQTKPHRYKDQSIFNAKKGLNGHFQVGNGAVLKLSFFVVIITNYALQYDYLDH